MANPVQPSMTQPLWPETVRWRGARYAKLGEARKKKEANNQSPPCSATRW